MKIEIQATLEKDDGYVLVDVEEILFDFLNKEFYLTSEKNYDKSYKQIFHNRKKKICKCESHNCGTYGCSYSKGICPKCKGCLTLQTEGSA